jgi:hypothetical protein
MWLTKGSANCGNRNAARLSTIHRCVIGWLRRARTRVECTHGRRRKNPPTALGQSWTYAKHDLVTGITVDTEVDRISAVVRTVEIESHSGTTEDAPVVHLGDHVGLANTAITPDPRAVYRAKYRTHGEWCLLIRIGPSCRCMRNQFRYGPATGLVNHCRYTLYDSGQSANDTVAIDHARPQMGVD